MRKVLPLILIISSLFLCICFSSCERREENPNAITDYLKSLNSYSTEINIIIKNDKQTINYSGNQLYLKGVGYKQEIGKDRIYIYKQNKIYVKDIHNSLKYVTDISKDSIYKYSFIGEYVALLYTEEKISLTDKVLDNQNYVVVRLDIPGNNRNMENAELYVNKKTKLPYKLLIKDSKGKEKIEVMYNNFKPNAAITNNEFAIN